MDISHLKNFLRNNYKLREALPEAGQYRYAIFDRLGIPMMSISCSDLMPIRSETSELESQVERPVNFEKPATFLHTIVTAVLGVLDRRLRLCL